MVRRLLVAGALLQLCMVTRSQATVIDDFEDVDFSIVSPANGPGTSVHHLGDPASIIGGDRDVWTLIHNGPGSKATLTTTAGNDSVVITSNEGSIYQVYFQYDGIGFNSRALNYNLALDGDDAILVDVSSVTQSPASAIEIQMFLYTKWNTPERASARLGLTVDEPGLMSFPFSAFEQFGELDFSDLDEISLTVTLAARLVKPIEHAGGEREVVASAGVWFASQPRHGP